MKKIYERAEHVCVWLGESSYYSTVGMTALTDTFQIALGWKMWKADRKHRGILPPVRERWKSSENAQTSSSLLTELEYGEIRDLLTRPWWTRVWIMQEAIVAKRLIFLCGNDSAPWDSIERFINRAAWTKNVVAPFGIVLNEDAFLPQSGYALISKFRQLWREERWKVNVYELMYEFRNLGCTDAKDRIYGFLGLVERSLDFQLSINLDYSTHDVYVSVARNVIYRTGTLDMLNCMREWRNVGPDTRSTYAFSLHDQARYHDTRCAVQDQVGKPIRLTWMRLPPGWERVQKGDLCHYYDWNSRSEQPQSPYANAGAQHPQSVASQRILPQGWEKDWDNLGRATIRFRPLEKRRKRIDPLSRGLSQLPSWVPNWEQPTHWDPAPLLTWLSDTTQFWAGGALFQPKDSPELSKSLDLRGIQFDTITRIAEAWHPESDIPPVSRKGTKVLRSWEEMATVEMPDCPYGGPVGRKNAIWRTHIADCAGEGAAESEESLLVECWYDRVGWAESIPSPDEFAGKGIWETATMQGKLRNMENAMFDHLVDDWGDSLDISSLNPLKWGRFTASKRYGQIVKRIYRTCAHRAMFITERGYIGLAPWNAQVGDMVYVLYGGKTPFILRRLPSVGEYRLVGECYTYGLMAGEALQMSLPSQEVRIS